MKGLNKVFLENEYRTQYCNAVSEKDIGRKVRAAGWVENIRDHGGVSFIDLRDMYGVVQVVLRNTDLLHGIVKEDCVSIEGLVEKRDEETYNPKIPSGTIGTVEFVDDAGQIHTVWDGHGSLAMIYGVDEWRKIQS